MDANQQSRSNPFGMDETCTNCPELCETRRTVVHGHGDVGADFLFVGEMPDEGADRTGVPFTGDERGEALQNVLGHLGLNNSLPTAEDPELENVYLTYLTRCRDPERPPTDEEIRTCEPYLNAEIRMINPEIIVPVGERALEAIAAEYTTTPAEEFDLEAAHATTIRGRGFELVPMVDPLEQTDEQREAFLDHFLALMGSDYRQTKGRRGR
ncbi:MULTISPECIES: uracil-DNA glycosylase [Halorussus]|uniref:uracil-DNA glycosylase n=1 Tax=Halorussus TaxID=1070314 RepID=UPI0020A1A91B|nr:uracil-DNA glycosylase [Halorussus vallis]USZ76621.1 uracil-DNA glycosylase [Halorussus vallis]